MVGDFMVGQPSNIPTFTAVMVVRFSACSTFIEAAPAPC